MFVPFIITDGLCQNLDSLPHSGHSYVDEGLLVSRFQNGINNTWELEIVLQIFLPKNNIFSPALFMEIRLQRIVDMNCVYNTDCVVVFL